MVRHHPPPTAPGRWHRLQASSHNTPLTKALLAVLAAGLILAGTIQPGAAWEIFITPTKDVAKFKVGYGFGLSIEYPDGSAIKDELHDKPPQIISKTYALHDDPDVKVIADKLNARIAANNSQARITDLSISYHTGFKHISMHSLLHNSSSRPPHVGCGHATGHKPLDCSTDCSWCILCLQARLLPPCPGAGSRLPDALSVPPSPQRA